MDRRSYAVVTGSYWAFTLSDGALRMLVLLHFHDLGFGPIALANLFLAYEFMGVLTNLIGGWVGARHGLGLTLRAGLSLQVIALTLLSLQNPSWDQWLSVLFVMGLQALSGVAKDLTKMSSKSAVKFVAGDGQLFRWVAALTGSKNALKGVGFFLGGAMLGMFGFASSLRIMAAVLLATVVATIGLLSRDLGQSRDRTPLTSILSTSAAINRLSAARLFLFGARDIWFVVALPVFLTDVANWSFESIGAFMAVWVIGYGIVQTLAPTVVRRERPRENAIMWSAILALTTAALATSVALTSARNVNVVVVGLIVFGLVFAVNSSLHSYLILAFSERDTALDVGFYYSANAAGRLVGTVLSGVLYLAGGFTAAICGSVIFLLATWALTLRLPPQDGRQPHDHSAPVPILPVPEE